MSDNKGKRVALYMRVAHADQLSISNQEKELRQYAKHQGHINPLIYADNGHGGLNFIRPAFIELNQDIKDGKIDKVIVKDISRIGRDSIQVSKWLEEMQHRGIEFDTLNFSRSFELVAMSDIYKKFCCKDSNNKKGKSKGAR